MYIHGHTGVYTHMHTCSIVGLAYVTSYRCLFIWELCPYYSSGQSYMPPTLPKIGRSQTVVRLSCFLLCPSDLSSEVGALDTSSPHMSGEDAALAPAPALCFSQQKCSFQMSWIACSLVWPSVLLLPLWSQRWQLLQADLPADSSLPGWPACLPGMNGGGVNQTLRGWTLRTYHSTFHMSLKDGKRW